MRNNAEEQLQKVIVQHLKIRGNPDCIWYHPANNVPASPRTGARFKALGVVPGIPDLAFVLADGRAAYMELKAIRGRLSPEQKLFQAKCERLGIEHAVCFDLDTALRVLEAWSVIQ